MVKAIRQEVTVQKENVIEIHSLALKLGTHVEVILLLSFLGKGKGSFISSNEVDAFIWGERNQWE